MKVVEPENVLLKRLNDEIGFGCFHVLILVLGSCIALCVQVALISISLVMPVIGSDLELSSSRKGGIEACLFVGMLFGAMVFGWFSDVYGRRTAMLLALPVTGASLLFSAFSFHWVFFLVMVMCVGIGTGGTIAPLLTYVAECSAERFRGPLLIIVQTFQDVGIVCATFMAWFLMGTSSEVSQMSVPLGSLRFVAWRLYLVLCASLMLLMVVPLLCAPESPLFLLHSKQDNKLQQLLKKMQGLNSCGSMKCCFAGGKDHAVKKSLSNVELLNHGPQTSDALGGMVTLLPGGTREPEGLNQLVGDIHTKPEQQDGAGTQQQEKQDQPEGQDGAGMLLKQEQQHDIVMEHFCIRNCFRAMAGLLHKFIKLVSTFYCSPHVHKTIVLHVVFFTTLFGYYGAKLWFPEIFKRMPLYKATHPFQIMPHSAFQNQSGLQAPYVYYQDALFIALSAIPVSIVAVVIFKALGAKILLVASGLVATVAGIGLWFVPMEHNSVLVLSCVYNAATSLALSSLKIGAISIYPTAIRSTALGLHNGVGRLGAIAGNIVFGELVDTSVALPMLLSAGMVLLGTGVAVFIPRMYSKQDQPIVHLCISKMVPKKPR